ncbi:MAG TPA: hypothetical protein DEF05_12465 [Erwinia sp.]|nr:hypothetical protein [Erwinia sp.]
MLDGYLIKTLIIRLLFIVIQSFLMVSAQRPDQKLPVDPVKNTVKKHKIFCCFFVSFCKISLPATAQIRLFYVDAFLPGMLIPCTTSARIQLQLVT